MLSVKLSALRKSLSALSFTTLCLLSVAPLTVHSSEANNIADADVRLLIDISGSMKKNDPQNLRIPAVNLLTELVPDGNKAGVWTFGQWVNNLIKYQAVDDKWRQSAKAKASEINSVALFTNIGAVLEKSSQNLSADETYQNTHFILLTDGMVDIDKDPETNTAERERILGAVLDKFKRSGAKIHAVALSKHADKSLMDKLAIQTGGQSALAETPEDLNRIFLQAFDQAMPKEQVPIEGNGFVVDSSIEEFTALVFRGDAGKPTRLVGPDEKAYDANSKSEDVKWYQDKGYDLITVVRPLEGEWLIDADIQPDSRVTVVSNLKLDVTKLSSNVFVGDELVVAASFQDENGLITDTDFLEFLEVDLKVQKHDGSEGTKRIENYKDGVFTESITKLKDLGAYDVTVLVDGQTFKRKFKQTINLRSPFDFEFSARDSDGPSYELEVLALSGKVDIAKTSVFAKVKAPDGSSLIKSVELDPVSQKWLLAVAPDKGDGVYKVAVKVKGKQLDGSLFRFSPQVFEAEFPIPMGLANKIVSNNEPSEKPDEELDQVGEEPKEAEQVESQIDSQIEPDLANPVVVPEESVVDDVTKADTEDSKYMLWGAIAAGVGSLLAMLGAVFYFVRKKRAAKESDDEEVVDDAVMDSLMDSDDELDFVEESEPES
jgi:uncharacterized protein (TIGR03503 family)